MPGTEPSSGRPAPGAPAEPVRADDVIHDIGFRHYDGTRNGRGWVVRSLLVETVRGVFGLGRPARSKVMPWALIGILVVPPVIIALSILLFAALGSVLEGLPAIVLFGPLMFPIARGLGVDEIYYAIVAILAMSLGLFTPPFGVGFYITCAIGGADPNRAMRYLWPYLAVLAVGVLIVAAVPWLSIGLIK